RRTLPGGSKLPNRWGLFDLVGNLWERCEDRFGPPPSGVVVNPLGAGGGSGWVFQGGAYDSGSIDCLAGRRIEGTADRTGSGGFRVVCGEARTPRADVRRQVAAYGGALEMMPDNAPLLRTRAVLYVRLGEWPAAAADYRRALEREPTDYQEWCRCAPLLVLA